MARPKVYPCLWFDHKAEEAANFYVALLPDSRIDNVWRSPAETPSGPEGMVLLIDFTVAGQQLQALTAARSSRSTRRSRSSSSATTRPSSTGSGTA